MKYLLTLLIAFTVLSCGGDDESSVEGENNFELIVTIDNLTYNSAIIKWNTPLEGDYIYRVVINNVVVADGLQTNSYSFSDPRISQTYSGTIFETNQNGDETFANFSFTTLDFNNCVNGFRFSSQGDINNVQIAGTCSYIIINGNDIIDLTPLSVLTGVNRLEIQFNPQLTNLNGLENLRRKDSDAQVSITVLGNDNITDISALSDLFFDAQNITISQNESLNSLEGFRVSDNCQSLSIRLNPISFIPNLEAHSLYNIELLSLNLTNLTAFSSVQSINSIDLSGMINLTGLDGLENLEKLYHLRLNGNPNLIDTSSLEMLNGSSGIGERIGLNSVFILNNSNLTDYCGLKTWMQNTAVRENQFAVYGNAYNPTEAQIESSTECSQ